MTVNDVLLQYENGLRAAEQGIAQARLHHSAAGFALTAAVALVLVLGVYALRRQSPVWWPSVPVPAAAAAARLYARRRQSESRLRRLKRFYERAIERVRGNWRGKGLAGEEFDDPNHLYARDLNIFGDGSLFELLCIARSEAGSRRLAHYLSEAPSLEETLARQEAVRELAGRTDLREKVALLGPSELSESKWDTFAGWLDLPPVSFPRPARVAILITSGITAVIILAGLLGVMPAISALTWVAPLLLWHGIAGLIYRRRVTGIIDSLGTLSIETQVLRGGLTLLEGEQFQSAKFRGLLGAERSIKSDTALGRTAASGQLRRLEWLLNVLGERNKDWFQLSFLVLMLGTQLCMAIEDWRKRNGDALRNWLDAWAEFEALNALACYAYENPGYTFPEFSKADARFEARALGHPLLPGDSCVRNDIELNHESRFYVISGSNMSGKSTLLRAIGLNAVLALAGAPVRAERLRISGLSICASLRVADSLLNGRSKFLAEVERVRAAIQMAGDGRPVLYLIDEIFGGTNSRDRRLAAEAVIRTLSQAGAIGALSTHDLALTEIAGDGRDGGVNVHMGSRPGGGPMDFDYRLKPGVTREVNALAIARMAGVPV